MSTQQTTQAAICQVCGARCGDGVRLCPPHTHRLADELREVPGLLLELDVTISRGDRVTVGAGVGRSAERPLAWNEHASVKRGVLVDTLTAWGVGVPLLAEPGYVSRLVAELRRHEHAGTGYDEIVDAVRGVRRAIDRPDMATRFYAGPCPELVDDPRAQGNPGADPGVPCSGEVWASIPIEADVPAVLRCLTCKAKWGTAQWLRVGQRMLARMAQLRDEVRTAA